MPEAAGGPLPMHAQESAPARVPMVPRATALRGHTRIASLMAATRADLVTAIGRLGPGVDMAEVRLDGLWPHVPQEDEAAEDLVAVTEALAQAGVPAIATLRPVREGGRFVGPEEVRVGLLAAAARAGFAAVDLEVDAAQAGGIVSALERDADVVVSHHAPVAPSCDDGGRLLLAMRDHGTALDKLVFGAGSYADVLRALELVRKHALRQGGRPGISTLGMGGAPLRALLALAGNRCTYGHAASLPPAAPGQPALADAQALWDHWGLRKEELDALAESPAPWLAVLGTPILHSLSPRLHNAALRAAGRPERFGVLEVPASAAALRLTCIVAKRIGLAGASVTVPHKQDALRMGPANTIAKAVGAANCLRFGDGEPEATNTDALALRRLLEPHVDANAPAVVVGAGGAARAAIWALRELGAVVRFTSRDAQRAQVVARDLGAKWTPWEERGDLAAQAWVQATPLQAGAPSPVSPAQLQGRPLAVELAYAPDSPQAGGKAPATPFESAARAAGCPVVEGRTVLLEQAVDAYRFWFAQEPDRAAMAAAIGGNPG